MNNFFKKAQPVWAENRENEMNVTLVFKAKCTQSSKAVLRITGSSYYNVYINAVSYTHLTLPTILRV